MTAWDQGVLLVVSDSALKKALLAELLLRRPQTCANGPRGHYQVSICDRLEEAIERQSNGGRLALPIVILDQSALGPAAELQAQWGRVRELAATAPVILTVEPGCLPTLNGLAAGIAGGRIEVVYRSGAFVSLVMALVARHSGRCVGAEAAEERGAHLGETLRHELNNPLTGILGNAELLLARRDKLPPGAAQRLKTIADLAVHLRETVRRLSNAWDEHSARLREMEVSR
jgi:signal transduction histidine kinase